MATGLPPFIKETLTQKLVDSLTAPFPKATPRRVHGAVRFPGKASALVGMRRAGKTTFVHQLRSERVARGAARESLPYLNFEDERLAGLTAEHLGFVVDELARRLAGQRSGGSVAWAFDEIQVVPGWERFVRRLLDSGDDVIVIGSSAALLSREIATAFSVNVRGWRAIRRARSRRRCPESC